MHRFQIPIGDWSCDGHCRCEWFSIISNKSLEEVREIYFKGDRSLEGICADYEDSVLYGDEPGFKYFDKDELYDNGDYWTPHPRDFCQAVMNYLMAQDPSLKLEFAAAPNMLVFYGYDDQSRHISGFGYGLFQ